MRRHLILLVMILGGIHALFAQEFKIDTVFLKSEHKIISSTYYRGHIYGLDDRGKIFKVNTGSQLIEIVDLNRKFEHIFNINNRLVAQELVYRPKTYEKLKEYYYDGKRFRRKAKTSKCCRKLHADENYKISSSCHGEWGGTIYFKNKHNHKKYECAATCPIVVNKIQNSYYITATLGHGHGLSEVLQIDDPTKLASFKRRSKRNFYTYESTSTEGASILVDSVGLMILTSFVHNDNLYHIISTYHNPFSGWPIPETYLSKIKNGTLQSIMRITDSFLWRNKDSTEIPYEDGFFLAVENEDTQEPLVLQVNTDLGKITIYRFEQKI